MSVAISDASGDYGAVIVSGANLLVDPAAFAEPGLWQGARALILQNEMPDATNIAAARAARAAGATVCLNAAPYRPLSEELAALVDLLVVNAIEAEELGGLRRDRSRLGGARQPRRLPGSFLPSLSRQAEMALPGCGGARIPWSFRHSPSRSSAPMARAMPSSAPS